MGDNDEEGENVYMVKLATTGMELWEKFYNILEVIYPIDVCMTCVIEFNVITTCTMIFQNKCTHIIISFASYMAGISGVQIGFQFGLFGFQFRFQLVQFGKLNLIELKL